MNAVILATMLLSAGPHWSIAPDGSLILVAPPAPVEIVIIEPSPSATLVRLPGPRHAWPHGTCLMCLGNRLIQQHGYDRTYLDKIGSSQWGVLFNNDLNTPGFRHGEQARGTGYYSGGTTTRKPLRERWKARWRR